MQNCVCESSTSSPRKKENESASPALSLSRVIFKMEFMRIRANFKTFYDHHENLSSLSLMKEERKDENFQIKVAAAARSEEEELPHKSSKSDEKFLIAEIFYKDRDTTYFKNLLGVGRFSKLNVVCLRYALQITTNYSGSPN
jgi:hypothetical protein